MVLHGMRRGAQRARRLPFHRRSRAGASGRPVLGTPRGAARRTLAKWVASKLIEMMRAVNFPNERGGYTEAGRPRVPTPERATRR